MPKSRRYRNPGSTRTRVLEAAAACFSEKGFAGTSMRDISRASGVLQSLIHHHFGTKQELWQEVLRSFGRRYRSRQDAFMSGENLDRSDFLKGAETLFRFQLENPELLRLSLWAALEPIPTDGEADDGMIDAISARLQAMQAGGTIRPDIDPGLLGALVAGMTEYWVRRKPDLSRALRLDPDDATTDRRYFDTMVKVLTSGCLLPPSPDKTSP